MAPGAEFAMSRNTDSGYPTCLARRLRGSSCHQASPLYAFVSREVGCDRCLAEDIVRDTWLRALGQPARIASNGSCDDERGHYTAVRDRIVDLDADFLDLERQNHALKPPLPGAP